VNERRWRKSHHNKNLTAPHSQECEGYENNSSADRGLIDRQLITGFDPEISEWDNPRRETCQRLVNT
jgi:hypothetical protein